VAGTKRRPYGSTGATRERVLQALGVVKVATAAQLRQLTCPGTASDQTVRNGLLDLAAEGLVQAGGTARRDNEAGVLVAQKLWHLTPAGLEAAAALLGRPAKEMGGTAKGAAASGAKHAVRVTDTIDAFLQTPPEPTSPVVRKNAAPRPRRELPVRPAGLGTIGEFSTEVVLPVTGTVSTPGRGSPRADAVLTAPDQGVPLLFIEVDNGTEGPAVLAEKIAAYRRFGRRQAKDTGGREVPLWRTMFPGPATESHPPLALVFTKSMGEDAMWERIRQVADLSRACWRPQWTSPGGYYTAPEDDRDGYFDYTDTVPVLATTLARLYEHGPHGPIWWRFSRKQLQTLEHALDNPKDERAYLAREDERRRLQALERQEQERRREAQGRKDRERWEKQTFIRDGADRVERLARMWDNPHRIDLRE
jgi:hypothetical protein